MLFKDVVGQEEIKTLLKSQVDNGRLPHALLLAGETGCGTLALALALANYILCNNKVAGDSCGVCPNCVKTKKIIHSDLHFSFPFIKVRDTTTADTYLKEWREHLLTDKYFDLNDWLNVLGSDNKMPLITEAESDNIIRKMSLSSYEGGWKIMIIWLPEKMNGSASNNLLKILEEPTKNSLFILCAEHAEEILPTILSRLQRIDVPPLSTEELCRALIEKRGVDKTMAMSVARVSGGNYLKALKTLCSADNTQEMFDSFVSLMRLAYMRDVPALLRWSEEISSFTRSRQSAYLAYMQEMLRENFMYNFGRPELNFMTAREREFSTKFARFINERNIIKFYEEFSRAQRDVVGNVSGKTIFFNLALQTIMLLRS